MAETARVERGLSITAGVMVLRSVAAFIRLGGGAGDGGAPASAAEAPRAGTAKRSHSRPGMPPTKPPNHVLNALYRTTHFNKRDLLALWALYRKLAGPGSSGMTHPAGLHRRPAKTEGIEAGVWREVIHSGLQLVCSETLAERAWAAWDGGEGALRFVPFCRALSLLVRGTATERAQYAFRLYDLNDDGYITKDEIFTLLKNSMLTQPGDEEPEEGVRELVELALRKLDADGDGRVSQQDYLDTVAKEPLLLEALGHCLPSRTHCDAFIRSLHET